MAAPFLLPCVRPNFVVPPYRVTRGDAVRGYNKKIGVCVCVCCVSCGVPCAYTYSRSSMRLTCVGTGREFKHC